jgi:putative ABC transport system permease protein
MRGVPVGRRSLLADWRRLLASVVGVGLAVMLILLLDGVWSGIRAQSRVYTDKVGADLYVLQPGIRDLTAGTSSLPMSTLTTVRADPDVTWAAPVRTAYLIAQLHGRKVATYLVGSVPGERGGAWALSSGRTPRADDEVVLGSALARRHGLHVGDYLDVFGRQLRIVGIAPANGFMMSYVFVTHHAFEQLSSTPNTTSVILIGTDNTSAAVQRLRAEGLNVLTRDQVAHNDVNFATAIFGGPIRLMVGIGLAAGTMIIALTAYTTIIERRREYGIVKAMGATRGHLVALALFQTLTLAALGLVAGWLLFLVGRELIISSRPQFTVLLTSGAVWRATIAAFVMALLAAIVPARRLAALEPAVAYRSTS